MIYKKPQPKTYPAHYSWELKCALAKQDAEFAEVMDRELTALAKIIAAATPPPVLVPDEPEQEPEPEETPRWLPPFEPPPFSPN